MTDAVIVAIIAGLPGIITAVQQYKTATKTQKVKEQLEANTVKLDSQKDTFERAAKSVNGHMDKLLSLTKEKSYKQGVKDVKEGKEGMYE